MKSLLLVCAQLLFGDAPQSDAQRIQSFWIIESTIFEIDETVFCSVFRHSRRRAPYELHAAATPKGIDVGGDRLTYEFRGNELRLCPAGERPAGTEGGSARIVKRAALRIGWQHCYLQLGLGAGDWGWQLDKFYDGFESESLAVDGSDAVKTDSPPFLRVAPQASPSCVPRCLCFLLLTVAP